jgi:hypothetical protein
MRSRPTASSDAKALVDRPSGQTAFEKSPAFYQGFTDQLVNYSLSRYRFLNSPTNHFALLFLAKLDLGIRITNLKSWHECKMN